MADADFEDSHWRSAGERIQALLAACATDGPAAQARAEQLVGEVVDLYGAALTRVMAAVDDPALAEHLAADDLVGSLLLVHGIHPHDVTERVSRALDGVRPYLGSHGGDVRLLGIADGVVRLSFSGSCSSCPSSAVTLELAVEDAVRTAAPEIDSVEAVAAEVASAIPVDSLMSRVHSGRHEPTTWYAVPELEALRAGEVAGFAVGDIAVLACRVGDAVLAYLDQCPGCANSMSGATLSGAVLRCPSCHARFDVVHAGAGTGESVGHLRPVPVLARDGVLSMAVPAQPMEASA
ncbi:NifU family protein [Candidatus Mycolicibacterium alkanivorans]|uniref:NifU family protein n=1 Tax=Candidatus Mycolicibacterium alkanivorans TaxID=2954114 RepID=A0ABS9YZJ3_9MYCO|nr:NifU family protein [Candidatus Mycolicibacterium alkanivorans]MCI4676677.1 NifU family protein [Candidatus Mycolicibacterium alkanivorans]